MLGLVMKTQGDQLRGPCPACRSGGDRALAVNTTKQSFYCFNVKKGGDLIALAAHIRDVSQRDAALLIADRFGNSDSVSVSTQSTVPNRSPQPPAQQGRELKPLDYLVFNEAVAGLGVSEATCKAFGAGYAPKGIMRGRFAVPIHAKDGTLLAYVGVAVAEEQSPKLLYPNGFDPHSAIFGSERVQPGELYLVRDPLQVLTAFESGVENVVAFLAPITPQSLEMLASLCDEKKVETIELF
jgi:hypothetical protein